MISGKPDNVEHHGVWRPDGPSLLPVPDPPELNAAGSLNVRRDKGAQCQNARFMSVSREPIWPTVWLKHQ